MSYRYDKEKKNQTRWYVVGTLFLALGLFTPVYSWIFDIIEQPLARTWENQERVLTGSENFLEALYSKKQIVEKNAQLRSEVARLEVDNLRTRYLSEELEKVYGLLDIDSSIIPAHILQHGVLGSRDSVILDKGERDDISVGDGVIADGNVLIGFVDTTYDKTARVTLYSNPEQSITGVLFPHNINMIARGHGNGGFLIEAPREIEATIGDVLYSLSEPGRIIAIVREIVFDPRDPFKQVYLSYPKNINEIQIVGVKKPTQN